MRLDKENQGTAPAGARAFCGRKQEARRPGGRDHAGGAHVVRTARGWGRPR